MNLSNEQAQAVVDAIREVDHGYISANAIEMLERRFPGRDWWALCEPGMADPRPLIPRKPRTAAEGIAAREAMDRGILEYGRAYDEREMSKPTLLKLR